MDIILAPYIEATIKRIKRYKVVLAPQNTTTLNYCIYPATMGPEPINNVDDKSMELILHDTLAFNENGTPLGILDAQYWTRNPEDNRKSYRRKELSIEDKESMKWLRSFRRLAEIQRHCPETMLISIGDREADIYELFLEASKDPLGPKLLVRAEKSRNRKVKQQHLWDFMSEQDIAGAIKIHIPKQEKRKARDAIVDIRYSMVELGAPRGSDHLSTIVWAVYLREEDSKEDVTPIEWMLLTTVEVSRFKDARRCVEWYCKRWGIEAYHRMLKSWCRTKEHQLLTADRLETCLGVDMVVAWRIYHMQKI